MSGALSRGYGNNKVDDQKRFLKYVMNCIFKKKSGASLVGQWLRISLPMQGTRVRVLVWEDPTCRGAARPVSHNY